jgi:hypothetical protein
METQMREAAKKFEFEKAARLRDTIKDLRAKELISGPQMTGISGPEFVAELRGRMPWVPVLVVGGIEKDYQGIDGVYFAANPSAEELRRLAGELLGGVGVRQTA